MTLPLAGLGVRIGEAADRHGYAASLFADLGADISADAGLTITLGPGGARLERPADFDPPGIPAGTVELGAAYGLVLAAVAGFLAGRLIDVPLSGLLAQMYLPLVMAASYDASPPAVRSPRPVGDGFVDDATNGDDAEAFERLLGLLPGAGPEEVAAGAQEWRLPVAPYRLPRRLRPAPFVAAGSSETRRWSAVGGTRAGSPPLTGTKVVDLTALWAGPLATWLLAALGSEVTKVEPASRLDGFRALGGGGIYPDDVFVPGRGDRSGWFNALNRNKLRASLDARTDTGPLLDLVAGSDVVVDNFSRRVMGNLGLSPTVLAAHRPGIVAVSLPAFSPGPEGNWVAFGTGVHAAAGLGTAPTGFAAPTVAYPDPLAGLAAAAVAATLLAAREAGWEPRPAEVSVAAATAPLTGLRRILPPGGEAWGTELLAAAETDGVATTLTDGAGTHLYPVAPFLGEGIAVPDRPAPTLDVE